MSARETRSNARTFAQQRIGITYIYVTKYTHNIIYIYTQYIEVLLSRLGSGTTLRAGEYGQYTGSRWGNN